MITKPDHLTARPVTPDEKLAAFLALMERRQHEHAAAEAQARKDREDQKLTRLRPWWVEAA